MPPVYRFAPSPNGYLHLGHAYSALLNQQMAGESGGRFLLRIEDIDTVRCRDDLTAAAFEDLAWLGLSWETPVLRQSSRFGAYGEALARLNERRLLYPCFCSRRDSLAEVAALEAAGRCVARDPDGAALYSGACRSLSFKEGRRRMAAGEDHSLRLDMTRALSFVPDGLTWLEDGAGTVPARPDAWGDVIIKRKETPTSYHLAVVIDDAFQGVTHVVRGRDLYEATGVHRLLQTLLGLPSPVYRHHDLIRDDAGQKLAKSKASLPVRQLRAEGVSADEVRARLGF